MSSRNEELLAAFLNGTVADIVPQSRNEELLLALLKGEVPNCTPLSRKEALLYAAAEQGLGGGGGVTIRNQNKTITENGEYTADSGYTGLGVVTVNVAASGGGDNALLYSILDRSITEFSNSELTEIGASAFRECKSLQKVSLPNVETVKSYAFNDCSILSDINFPKLKGVVGMANIAVEYAHFPKATSIGYGSFGGNSKLKRIVLDVCTSLEGHCLKGDTSLTVIVIRTESVAKNAGSHTLQNTPFADGGTGGVLLAPASVVEEYKTATNWSVFYAYGHNRYLALEDYTVDGTITGEIDWDKVNALFE